MTPKFRLLSSEQDFKTLKKTLEKQLPHSTQMYNLIHLRIKNRFPKTMQIDFYLYEDPTRSGTTDESFIVCTQKPNIHSLYGVITLAPKSRISPAMLETFDSFIDWENVRLFSNGHPSFTTHLKVLANEHGNLTEHPEGIPGCFYYLDIGKAVSIPDYIPPTHGDRIEVKKLCVEDAETLMSNWKWGLSHSKEQIEESIKSLDSIGVYVNSKLASYAILSPLGFINILYTDEAHRRKGYGEVAIQALSKSVASQGLIPGAEAEAWNDPSKILLGKVGFQWGFDIEWIYFEK